ncbi:MAG: transporter [Desulfobacterales bacterium]|nr:transporter [Desulfobacterales bacterium]
MSITSLSNRFSTSPLAVSRVENKTARFIQRGSLSGISKLMRSHLNVKQSCRVPATALTIALAILGVVAYSGLSWAGGGQAYTNGSEDFRVGLLPDPSVYYIHYTNYYNSDNFKDNDGDEIDEAPETTTFANTLRFLWVTDKKILGGSYATHIFVPIVYSDIDFDDPGDDPEFPRVPSGNSKDKFGLGNIIFTPFLLGWRGETFHYWINIADIFVPTNNGYDKNDAVNLGNNFWTIEPIFAFSWLPGKFEVTSKFMYDINTKNHDHIVTPDEAKQIGRPDLVGQQRSLLPGQEFHFDYVLGYHPNEQWELGAVGYFYQQVTDDEVNGEQVNNRRGRVFAIGPGVKYNFNDLSLVGKVYFETLVENRYKGVQSFFKLHYRF